MPKKKLPPKKHKLAKKTLAVKKVKKSEQDCRWAINLENIIKQYTLHHEKPTFVEKFFGRTDSETFLALNGVSLQIPLGQKVAVIGRNGSGKTTLLKILCEVTRPTSGKVITEGRVISLIDLEAGFHPEMNGYENIFLNGLLIGMTRKEVERKLKEIVDFADIGTFIDAPMYTYSQGMKLRLGFAVAVHADPDILVLDEMIATGDIGFQQKCNFKLDEFFKEGKTIITVSHVMGIIEERYDRFIWLERGQVKMDGGKQVLQKYKKYLTK
jgi:ABC-type polysaccharide/polyol phosphate transport system ATPase subunit